MIHFHIIRMLLITPSLSLPSWEGRSSGLKLLCNSQSAGTGGKRGILSRFKPFCNNKERRRKYTHHLLSMLLCLRKTWILPFSIAMHNKALKCAKEFTPCPTHTWKVFPEVLSCYLDKYQRQGEEYMVKITTTTTYLHSSLALLSLDHAKQVSGRGWVTWLQLSWLGLVSTSWWKNGGTYGQ